jgi:tRNA threonylcarbamoyladenosine biosynthesis protein TsaB
MRLLVIETATLEVGAALVVDTRVVASSASRPGRMHVETLHPAIEHVLAATRTSPAELDGVAVDVGPGLFTGLRVGVAAAKAIAFAASAPVVPVRSTEALRELAEQIFADEIPVVPLVDMRRGEIAWQEDGGPLAIGTAEEFAARVKTMGEVRLVGDGTLRLSDALIVSDAVHVHRDEVLLAPSVEAVGRIASRRAERGEFLDAISVAPVYLRPADAVANFTTRRAVEAGTRR